MHCIAIFLSKMKLHGNDYGWSVLLWASFLCLVVISATSVWFAFSVRSSATMDFVAWFATMSGLALLVVHIVATVLRARTRATHFCLVVLFIAAGATQWWSSQEHVEVRREWFVMEGWKDYNAMAAVVLANRSSLSDQLSQLQGVIDPKHGRVYGKTNLDGSVTIEFLGRDGSLRLGYLYHTGDRLRAPPSDPNGDVFYLTNNWYEF
jgi:hypothetical protein